MNIPRRYILPKALCIAIVAGSISVISSNAQPADSNDDKGLLTRQLNDVAPPAGDVTRGEERYIAKCSGCHSVDQNRIGPKHRGVYGRAAGGVEDYSYSPALTASGIIWNVETLDEWLLAPSEMVPGSRMGFSLPDAQERADVIAYLKSVSQ